MYIPAIICSLFICHMTYILRAIWNCYTAQQIEFLQCQLNAAFHCKLLNYFAQFCFAVQFAQCILLHNYNSCHKAAKRENDAVEEEEEDEEKDGENGQSAKLVMTFKKAKHR